MLNQGRQISVLGDTMSLLRLDYRLDWYLWHRPSTEICQFEFNTNTWIYGAGPFLMLITSQKFQPCNILVKIANYPRL